MRSTDLHREVCLQYDYTGSYWTFLRQVRPLRPAATPDPVVRFETLPGVQTQADWKHLGAWPLGEELVELHAMVAILGHGRRPAMRIASSCTRAVSFERLVRCFDDLGGVTRELPHRPRQRVLQPGAAGGAVRAGVGRPVRAARHRSASLPRVPRPDQAKVERHNREIDGASSAVSPAR